MPCVIDIDPVFDVAFVRSDWEFDVANAGDLRAALDGLSAGVPVVIDLTALRFLDSAGVGVLCGAIRRIHERGDVVAVCCGGPVARVLHTIGMHRIAPVCATDDEAVAVVSGMAEEARMAARSSPAL